MTFFFENFFLPFLNKRLKFNRRDDRRLRKTIERGAARIYSRRWQLYPEGDPITNKTAKWLIPYLYDDDVPNDARIDIDYYLADFGRQTCTKPLRITEEESFPKYRNHVRIMWINEGRFQMQISSSQTVTI